ncbi:cysteine-rich CWC family protein [Alicyclobacillus ferrooxydans]|uniref:cysteine-rich CWC family protein n=1 Tax=Alicyclobacillus ferrooxydans TaxID=471514 RepID=UPI0009F9D817|nr:cysteine-rich CWC family protein [Alicyclobacillus ferrooxydans]
MSGGKECPICGGDNNCGNLAGKPHGNCWCDKEVFPQEIFVKVASSPERKLCICRSCLEKFRDGGYLPEITQ